jgi:hypothetical protein
MGVAARLAPKKEAVTTSPSTSRGQPRAANAWAIRVSVCASVTRVAVPSRSRSRSGSEIANLQRWSAARFRAFLVVGPLTKYKLSSAQIPRRLRCEDARPGGLACAVEEVFAEAGVLDPAPGGAVDIGTGWPTRESRWYMMTDQLRRRRLTRRRDTSWHNRTVDA